MRAQPEEPRSVKTRRWAPRETRQGLQRRLNLLRRPKAVEAGLRNARGGGAPMWSATNRQCRPPNAPWATPEEGAHVRPPITCIKSDARRDDRITIWR